VTPPDAQPDPDAPLDDLKKAFDGLNQEVASAPEPTPAESEDMGDGAAREARQADSDAEDKGSRTDG
jgi:hypothetical protein